MGNDGHFASLFPDAENLSVGLNLENDASTLSINTSASPHPRLTMTLSRLVHSREIILLIFGEDKREVLEAPGGLPIAYLLQQHQCPVTVLWAP